jgi:hypothetical protein
MQLNQPEKVITAAACGKCLALNDQYSLTKKVKIQVVSRLRTVTVPLALTAG